MKNKIHLDNRVATLMDMPQGSFPYKGYSEVEVDKLIQFISSDSTKRMVEKSENISSIRVCACSNEKIPMYGDGHGWFYIGHSAKEEYQRVQILNHQEDAQ